jgi:hypothetical protein
MIALAAGIGLALFLLAVLLEEAWAWFSRSALDRLADDDESQEANDLARSARHTRLLARFLAAAAFVDFFAVAHRLRPLYGPAAVAVLAFAWAAAGSTLVAVRWRSPLALAGRAVYRPLARIGLLLRWLLVALHRVPGTTSCAGSSGAPARTRRRACWPPCTSSVRPAWRM